MAEIGLMLQDAVRHLMAGKMCGSIFRRRISQTLFSVGSAMQQTAENMQDNRDAPASAGHYQHKKQKEIPL